MENTILIFATRSGVHRIRDGFTVSVYSPGRDWTLSLEEANDSKQVGTIEETKAVVEEFLTTDYEGD